MSGLKHPGRVEGGREGARRRWGEAGRVVRIDTLPPSVGLAIRALVKAAEEAARAESTPPKEAA